MLHAVVLAPPASATPLGSVEGPGAGAGGEVLPSLLDPAHELAPTQRLLAESPRAAIAGHAR